MRQFTESEIEKSYVQLARYHKTHLEKYGVKLPNLKRGNSYTIDALTLIYLFQGYPKTRQVSKKELTQFIRLYYPDTNDVQQARHLAAQKGWYIGSGQRKNGIRDLKAGEYQLVTLEKPFPNFTGHRGTDSEDFEDIKKQYNYRCATCGSKEGEANYHWISRTTALQKGHMNPLKPLTAGNIIPQCDSCNRGDQRKWIYDEKGRVRGIADPKVVMRSDESIQIQIYKLLYKKFKGINPNE